MRLNSAKKVFIWSLILAIFTISGGIYAQTARKNDVILKRDSTRIQALILQMSYEKINYRDLGTRDSAKTYISLDQVARVYLKNGKIIHVRDSVLAGPVPPDSVGQYADASNLPANEFDKGVVMANSDQLRDKYRYYKDKSIDGKNGSIVFTSFAAASLVSGLIISGTGSGPDNKKIGTSLAIAGPVFGGVLGLIGYRNYKRNRTKAEKVRSELERRNQPLSNIKVIPVLNIFDKSAGLTLQMSF